MIQEVEAIAADANAALRGGVQTRQHAAFLQRHAERALGRAVSVEATLDALRDGTLPERLNLLSDIETTRVLRTDQSIRRLLVQELNRVNAARFESGALDRGVEQYRRRLATALARLREPTAIPALARSADVSPGVASALAEFGNLAVPDMLAVWDTRGDLPFLELEPLWLGLLRAFSAIAVDGSTSDDMRAALAPVVRNALEEPVNAGTLMAAVDLALLIEMPQFRTEVTALASGAEAILDRGIAEPDALRVEEYAVRQLAVLPGSGEANSMGFFVTSTGLGDGGNLGGLDGADAHCQALAAAVGAGDRTWRAYLSTQGRGAVNARDRIGEGPWANAAGLVVATSVEGLHFDNSNFNSTHSLDENGNQVASRIAGDADFTEHDVLTGSQLDGTAFPTGEDRTCGNWTSNDEGSAMLGHADRYSFTTPGAPWNTAHPSRGCSQEDLVATGGAGLFYCFAID